MFNYQNVNLSNVALIMWFKTWFTKDRLAIWMTWALMKVKDVILVRIIKDNQFKDSITECLNFKIFGLWVKDTHTIRGYPLRIIKSKISELKKNSASLIDTNEWYNRFQLSIKFRVILSKSAWKSKNYKFLEILSLVA